MPVIQATWEDEMERIALRSHLHQYLGEVACSLGCQATWEVRSEGSRFQPRQTLQDYISMEKMLGWWHVLVIPAMRQEEQRRKIVQVHLGKIKILSPK
jgi:hypothetical protein